MSIVAEKIQQIIHELEASSNMTARSAADIAKILLGEGDVAESAPQSNAPQGTNDAPRVCRIDMNAMEIPREAANNCWELNYYRNIYSCRPVIGKAIVFGKRVARKLMKFLIEPILKDQTEFNSNAVRTLNAMRNNDVVFQSLISQLLSETESNRQLIENLRAELENAKSSAADGHRRMDEADAKMDAHVEEMRKQFGEHAALLEEMRKQFGEHAALLEEVQDKLRGDQVYDDIDYFDFENNFRGTRAQIKEGQAGYLEYFRGCGNVLDIGSGRGEFLELMKENGIGATGVDLYKPFVDFCFDRGLKAVHQDGISYLQQQADQSLDGIIGLQIVEHISTHDLITLCNEAYRALQPGRKLVLETPNPTCVSTYLNSFYLDPSHVKPVHPKTLQYFLSRAGFKNIQIVFTEQSKVDYRLPLLNAPAENLAQFNDGVNFISDIVFGSQDYAIIAEK